MAAVLMVFTFPCNFTPITCQKYITKQVYLLMCEFYLGNNKENTLSFQADFVFFSIF